MQNILVYDIEAEELERIAEDNDMTVAEVVELLMEYAKLMRRENKLK